MGRRRFNHQIYSSTEDRLRWAEHISPSLLKIKAQVNDGKISSSEAVMAALHLYVEDLNLTPTGPRSFEPESYISNSHEMKSGSSMQDQTLHPFLRSRFKGIPERIQLTLEAWQCRKWTIDLMWSDPSPLEILKMVAQGKRCVSLFTEPHQLRELHEDKFDSFGFIIHDLMHAYQFHHSSESREGQIEFAEFLLNWIEALPHYQLDSRFLTDPDFIYLMSDMNSHPQHLKQTFLHHCQRLEATPQLQAFLRETKNVAFSEMITGSN